MKETKIEIPAGCEVEKIETQDGHVVVTFKEKERELPKTWDEFCEINRDTKQGESCIMTDCSIRTPGFSFKRNSHTDRNLLPDRATAEAVLALCQLIQLRDCYNQGWKPDWADYNQDKFTIEYHGNELFSDFVVRNSTVLYFKSEELRDQFLENFRDLIEKLKPLYGIKEGGEE